MNKIYVASVLDITSTRTIVINYYLYYYVNPCDREINLRNI